MKKRVFWIGLLMAIVLTLLSFLYDVEIIKFIVSIRNSSLDYLFLSFTFASNGFIIFFFLTSLFLWQERKRRWIIPLWMSLIVGSIISFILKILVQRNRPFQDGLVSVLGVLFNFMKTNFNTWNFSFPSFQALLVFCALPVLDKEFNKFKYVWILFAGLAAFSRVYFGVHYMSDVLAGAIIGYLIGYVAVMIEEKYKFGEKITKRLSKERKR